MSGGREWKWTPCYGYNSSFDDYSDTAAAAEVGFPVSTSSSSVSVTLGWQHLVVFRMATMEGD